MVAGPVETVSNHGFLTLKDIPTPLMARLRASAPRDGRSLNRAAIFLLDQALAANAAPATQL